MAAKRIFGLFTCVALLSALAVVAAAAADTDSARPDLTGHWVLNEKASDFPHPGGGEGGGRGMRGGGGGGGGMRGGGMGGGFGGGWGGGRGMRGGGGGGAPGASGGQGSGEGRGQGGGHMGLPNDMVVELAESELIVSVRGLPVRKLELGGASSTPATASTPEAVAPATSATPATGDAPPASPSGAPASGGAPAAAPAEQAPSMPAHWDGKKIVSEFDSPRGGKIKETWELAKDGKQLVVKTNMPALGERPSMEIKRVYDRVETD